MKHSQRIRNKQNVSEQQSRKQTKQHFVYCLFFLCLLFTAGNTPLYATEIKTQSAEAVLQIGLGTEAGATKNKTDTQTLLLPSDVAVHKNKIYVVDGSHHRIAVYDLQGKFLFSFGSKGNKAGQFNYPVGIDAASNNRIYVADSGNKRIQIFSDKGVYLSDFKIKKEGERGRPIDVMRHAKTGNLIVTSSNHHLLIYSAKGKQLKRWGKNGSGRSEFRYPATLAEMKDGRIAVVDVLNSRVQVFNDDGTLSLVVGEWGVLPGRLFRPKGVAIDANDNFYISDSYLGVVQKYGDDGIFKAVLGDNGKPYTMLTPVGMTIYKNRLYVVEMKNNKVAVYQLVK